MTPKRCQRFAACVAIAGTAAITAAPSADAAIGSIKFRTVEVGLSGAHHRPTRPTIVMRKIDGKWVPGADQVYFDLKVRARVNLGSWIWTVTLGLPEVLHQQNGRLAKTSWVAFNERTGIPHFGGAQEVRVTTTTHGVPSNALVSTLTGPVRVAQLCEANTTHSGFATVYTTYPIQVAVFAARGATKRTLETRTKYFMRDIPVAIRCLVTSDTHARAPQRTAPTPKRTKPTPKRTLPSFHVTKAELFFARASNGRACPVAVRETVRITSRGPGRAKFYLVRRDGQGTLKGPYYVDVKTRRADSYVGVKRVIGKFAKPFSGAYRVVVANESGPAVHSRWETLSVTCTPHGIHGDRRTAPPRHVPHETRLARTSPHMN